LSCCAGATTGYSDDIGGGLLHSAGVAKLKLDGDRASASDVVQATNVLQVPTNTPAPLNDAGNANPANNFRFDGGMYIFNLKTTGYASGTYLLGFVVSGDPVPHTVQFSVRSRRGRTAER